ncbi:hypothetical protein KY285_018660 [Solanum tuberosum]|nr:hypothetical protein KY285_018660 [Solanum tuberosum]
MDAPTRTCWYALTGAVRSTTFLSAFVGIFQAVICCHRKVASKDHKLVYWVAGALSGLSVLLEKKARRGELALYVLPRAADSLWYILVNRHLLPDIKNAEVPLFCACMGGIMYYLEHEPDTMAPFLRGLIRRFLASRISNPTPPSNKAAWARDVQKGAGGFIAKTMLGPPTQILGDGGNDRGFSWNKLHRTVMGRGGNWAENSAVVASIPGAASTRKNLNSVFESQAASSFSQSSIGTSSLISDDHSLLTESAAEDLLLIPETSPSSEAVDPLADLTPLSSTVTSDRFKECTGSNSRSGIPQISDVKFGSVEAEMAVKYIREAQLQVVNATDIDIRYKKLLDAVMNTVVEEFYGLPEDKDCYNAIVSKKFHLVTLTFVLWIIAVFIGFFFHSGEEHSFDRPLPT